MWLVISAALAASFPCDTAERLQAAAEDGNLSAMQRGCLEGVVDFAHPHQRAASELLITDADAAGDRARWALAVAHHLDHVDSTDPQLHFSYARFLFASHRSEELIDFTARALRHAAEWAEPELVVGLHRLRTTAAVQRWTETTIGEERVHSFAAAWVRASAETGRTDTTAVQVCRSSGDAADCDAGPTVASVD